MHESKKEVIKDKVTFVIREIELPLIVYTNHDNAINKQEIDGLIKLHKWILFSNNCINLLNSIFNVPNIHR